MSSDDKPIAPSIFGSLESPSVSTSTKASGKFRGKENPRSKGTTKSAAADGDNAGDAKDQPSSAPGGGRGGRGGGRGGGGGRGRGDGRKGDKAAAVAPEGVDPTVQNTGADPEGTSAPATTKPKRERPPRGKGGRGGNKGDDVEAKVAGGDSANAASFKDAVAPPAPPAPVKKYFKAVVRKLPPTKDFTRGDFEQALHTCVRSLATSNGIDANTLSLPDDVFVDHFLDGKIRYDLSCRKNTIAYSLTNSLLSVVCDLRLVACPSDSVESVALSTVRLSWPLPTSSCTNPSSPNVPRKSPFSLVSKEHPSPFSPIFPHFPPFSPVFSRFPHVITHHDAFLV